MKNCAGCGLPISDAAVYCHHCGRHCQSKKIRCIRCAVINEAEVKNCISCASTLGKVVPAPHTSPVFGIDMKAGHLLPQQLKKAFLDNLALYLEMEGESSKITDYQLAFEDSGFRIDYFEEYSLKLSNRIESLYHKSGDAALTEIDRLLEINFLKLCDVFYSRYITELLPCRLPANLADFAAETAAEINLPAYFRNCLILSEESFTYYEDAAEIPPAKLYAAGQHFFHPTPGETPLIFIDLTLFGSGSEGLILTSRAIYWKAAFHAKNNIPFSQLNNLQRFKNRLEINGMYFNVSASFNYRLLRMLNRLRLWYKV